MAGSLLNDQLSGKELFIRITARAFRKLLSVYVFSYFPFGFAGRMWDLIVTIEVLLLATAGLWSKQPGMERVDQVLIRDFLIGDSH